MHVTCAVWTLSWQQTSRSGGAHGHAMDCCKMYQGHPLHGLLTSPVPRRDVSCLSHGPQKAHMRDGAGTACRRHPNVTETTEGYLRHQHCAITGMSRRRMTDVSAPSRWRHSRDVPATSSDHWPDVRETSRPRPSGVMFRDVPETSSAAETTCGCL